jgi:hypothetical protein
MTEHFKFPRNESRENGSASPVYMTVPQITRWQAPPGRTALLPAVVEHGVLFDQWPTQRGLSAPALERCRNSHSDDRIRGPDSDRQAQHSEALSHLQEWLTFGLLESVLQREVRHEPYLKEVQMENNHDDGLGLDNSKPPLYFSTEQLLDDLAVFHEGSSHSGMEAGGAKGIQLALNSLLSFRRTHQRLRQWGQALLGPVRTEEPNSSAFTTWELYLRLGCLLTLSTLVADVILDVIFQHCGSERTTVGGLRTLPPAWVLDKHYQEMRIEGGWCPFALEKLSVRVSYSALFRLWYTRDTSRRDYRHKECTPHECQENRNSDCIERQHTEGCYISDNLVKPRLTEIKGAIEAQQIPLIELVMADDSPTPQTILKVVAASPKTPYIAVSHIWSQGRGSSTEDGLPRCQLMQIRKVLNRVVNPSSEQPLRFWMDSLCIPRDPGLRKTSITMMADIYRSAEIVVVVDEDLLQHSFSSSSSWTNMLTRIVLSPWMQRLWTFQEGVLAKRLAWVFEDR